MKDWRLLDEHGEPYDYADRRLGVVNDRPRRLQVQFRTPQAEALLALISEFVTVMYEAPPGANRWKNARRLVRLQKDGSTALLDDLGVLYDLVEGAGHDGCPCDTGCPCAVLEIN